MRTHCVCVSVSSLLLRYIWILFISNLRLISSSSLRVFGRAHNVVIVQELFLLCLRRDFFFFFLPVALWPMHLFFSTCCLPLFPPLLIYVFPPAWGRVPWLMEESCLPVGASAALTHHPAWHNCHKTVCTLCPACVGRNVYMRKYGSVCSCQCVWAVCVCVCVCVCVWAGRTLRHASFSRQTNMKMHDSSCMAALSSFIHQSNWQHS